LESVPPLDGVSQAAHRTFTIAMIAIVIGSVLGLAGPYTLQYLIDAVFTQNNAQLLNQITVILIIIFALQAVFYFIRAYQLQYIGERVMIDLRLNLFQHLQKLSLSFYNERRTGELVSRATNDVATVRTLVTNDVSTAIAQVITFFGALILILITDWHLTLFMLMLVPFVVIVAILFGRRLRKLSGAVQDQLADATIVLEESISGVRVVQSFTREDYEIGRYSGSIEQTFALALKRINLSATFGPVASFMGFTVVIAVFWFGGQQVLNGTLTAGQLTMFLILTLTIADRSGSSADCGLLCRRPWARRNASSRSSIPHRTSPIASTRSRCRASKGTSCSFACHSPTRTIPINTCCAASRWK
jgi:subfamily B ATP-binding cassette protein MsbA